MPRKDKIAERAAKRQEKEDQDQKHFEDIQNRFIRAQMEADAQAIRLRETENMIKSWELTREEVKTLDKSAVVYQKTGRAFFSTSQERAVISLGVDIKRKEDDLPRMSALLTAFQIQLKDATNSLKEVKISKPVLHGAVGN